MSSSLPSTTSTPPRIIPSLAALLLIDFQRDFCDPKGYAAVVFGEDTSWVRPAAERAKVLLEAARQQVNNNTNRKFALIVHTREGYAPDLSNVDPVRMKRSIAAGAPIGKKCSLGRLLIVGEYGQDIIDDLQPVEGEVVLDKNSYGAFYSTDLLERLRANGVQQLVLTGVTADVCVHTTLREAVDRGFECFYCKDAIASPDAEIQRACERMVEIEGGIWGWLVSVDFVVDCLTTENKECYNSED